VSSWIDTGSSQRRHAAVTFLPATGGTVTRVARDVLDPAPPAHGQLTSRAAARPSGRVEIRPAELQVLVDGRRVGFTVREFQIFSVLAARPDHVVRRSDIYEQVWGAPWVHRDRSVDVFVRKVRGKLAAVSPDWTYVHTHFGIGYRYSPEPAAEPGSRQ
jgi:DNA-binding response OmpR family regulator